MQAAHPCGNRRSLSEGSGRLHNGWDSQLIRLLLGCWLVRSCRSTTLSTVDELGVNPANQFGNLTDSGFGNMQAALPSGNRRSVLEGSGRLHNGWDWELLGSCWLLARSILRAYSN